VRWRGFIWLFQNFAEQYALAYEQVIWDRYLEEFGLY
jgi:hypothetical protein